MLVLVLKHYVYDVENAVECSALNREKVRRLAMRWKDRMECDTY